MLATQSTTCAVSDRERNSSGSDSFVWWVTPNYPECGDLVGRGWSGWCGATLWVRSSPVGVPCGSCWVPCGSLRRKGPTWCRTRPRGRGGPRPAAPDGGPCPAVPDVGSVWTWPCGRPARHVASGPEHGGQTKRGPSSRPTRPAARHAPVVALGPRRGARTPWREDGARWRRTTPAACGRAVSGQLLERSRVAREPLRSRRGSRRHCRPSRTERHMLGATRLGPARAAPPWTRTSQCAHL